MKLQDKLFLLRAWRDGKIADDEIAGCLSGDKLPPLSAFE